MNGSAVTISKKRRQGGAGMARNLKELVFQDDIEYPDREYILRELHYRSSIPISRLAIVNHFTFVQTSSQDKYYEDLKDSILRSFDVYRKDKILGELSSLLQGGGNNEFLTDRALVWLKSPFVTHALMFGAFERVKIEIGKAMNTRHWQRGEDVTEDDFQCLKKMRDFFSSYTNIENVERVISKLSKEILASVSQADLAVPHGILNSIEEVSSKDLRDVYVYDDPKGGEAGTIRLTYQNQRYMCFVRQAGSIYH